MFVKALELPDEKQPDMLSREAIVLLLMKGKASRVLNPWRFDFDTDPDFDLDDVDPITLFSVWALLPPHRNLVQAYRFPALVDDDRLHTPRQQVVLLLGPKPGEVSPNWIAYSSPRSSIPG